MLKKSITPSEADLKKMPLLAEFMYRTMASYNTHPLRERPRKGLAKGELIGFSRKKFGLSLQMLHDRLMVLAAKKSGVSHSVLLQWRTEAGFQNLVRQHVEDFAKFFVAFVRDSYPSIRKWEDTIYSNKMSVADADQMFRKGNPHQIFFEKKIADGGLYSSDLKDRIVKAIASLEKEAKKRNDVYMRIHFLNAQIPLVSPRLPMGTGSENVKKKYQIMTIDVIREALKDEPYSDSHRKAALEGLHSLERLI